MDTIIVGAGLSNRINHLANLWMHVATHGPLEQRVIWPVDRYLPATFEQVFKKNVMPFQVENVDENLGAASIVNYWAPDKTVFQNYIAYEGIAALILRALRVYEFAGRPDVVVHARRHLYGDTPPDWDERKARVLDMLRRSKDKGLLHVIHTCIDTDRDQWVRELSEIAPVIPQVSPEMTDEFDRSGFDARCIDYITMARATDVLSMTAESTMVCAPVVLGSYVWSADLQQARGCNPDLGMVYDRMIDLKDNASLLH
jgi:hypothetical protein